MRGSYYLKVLIVFAVVAVLLLGSCAQPSPTPASSPKSTPSPAPAPSPKPVPSSTPPLSTLIKQVRWADFATGSGSYAAYAYWMKLLQEATSIPSTVLAGGAYPNMTTVDEGKAELAQGSGDAAILAVKGTKPFTKVHQNIRFFNYNGFSIALMVAVPSNSPITSIKQLLGKRIAVGTGGSLSEIMSLDALKLYGITDETMRAAGGSIAHLSNDSISAGLLDKTLDAGFAVSSQMTISPAFMAYNDRFGIKLLPVEEQIRDEMAKIPGYSKGEVQGGIYKGNPGAVPTMVARSYNIINKDVPDAVAYKIMQIVYDPETQKKLPEIDPSGMYSGRYLTKPTAVTGFEIPVHPGVLQWAKDVGAPVVPAR